MPSLHFHVPGGTIKLKTYTRLSETEKSGSVPVWKFGRWRLVWWPTRAKASKGAMSRPRAAAGGESGDEASPEAPSKPDIVPPGPGGRASSAS